MALCIWLLLALILIAEGQNEKKLKWPKKYTTKARKMLLTSNFIEDYQIWRTKTKSRIDYNEGAVKSIVKQGVKFKPGSVIDLIFTASTRTDEHYSYIDATEQIFIPAFTLNKYRQKISIHPEASLNQSSQTVCYLKSEQFPKFENMLPDTDLLKFIGYENLNDRNTSKFASDTSDEGTRFISTLWAIYNFDKGYWSPIRYHSLTFNTVTGYKTTHEIWEFSEFSTKFSSKSIFNVEYDCKNTTTVTMDSDIVTKNLVFINPENDEHFEHIFNVFKMKYARKYTDAKEIALRSSIFKENMRHIVTTNRKNLGYKLEVNQFADRTPEEMTKYKGLRQRPEGKTGTIPFPYSDSKLTDISSASPAEYDLRLFGLVSEIKYQEECGSCWAFGTTAAAEGALARVNGGKLINLANQALLDCAWPFGSSGCDGGSDNAAYEWMTNYGLPTEAEYGAYKSRDGVCNIKNMTKTYPIRGYTDVTPLSINALKVALINHGPLSVSVHTSKAFIMYSSGIFYDTLCNQTSLNHEVTLVGYGEKYGDTFWILRNSWGPTWGIDGYMHISARDNNCGVATEPTYPVF